ncbi:MAG: AraC family transcriptional regulator [Ruminococcaceae bacterium]|nr:AraC family transcriptional regulator [Oscillospiraceae bacterium]
MIQYIKGICKVYINRKIVFFDGGLMNNVWYYVNDVVNGPRLPWVGLGSRQCNDLPLMVNCAGAYNQLLKHHDCNPTGRLDYYLIYLVSGEVEVYNGDESIIVKEGSIIVFPPNKGYKHKNDHSPISYFWVHFTGSDVPNILNRYGISLFPAINMANGENRISNRFQKLFDGFAKNDKFRDYDLSSLLDRILVEIARSISPEQSEKTLFSKSIRYINEFYSKPIKITDLARMENVSMTTYNLHFKRQMGMSPTQYILALRMHSAKELLESSKLPIREISAMCGYNDFNFFTKVFKKHTNKSPTEYRKG